MDNFIVSARKYRPVTFESVVGQESITHTLQNAIKNNHLAQALLFCGPRGVGKTTCARILAKAINLSEKNEDNADISDKDEDFSFNIFELDAASNNSVEDIRNLIDQVRFPPQIGKFKVYIIDEVHMLSSQAFNAFLKTLEEPPKHAIFILATTEKHKIIPTILSRCQIFDFNRIQINDIAAHLAKIAELENVTAEVDALHVIAEKADGALRDALSMFDQIVSYSGNELTYKATIENLNILDHDYYFKISDAIIEGSISKTLLVFNEILQNGFDGHNFIVGLEQHFRNLLVSKDSSMLNLLEVGGNIKEKYKSQSGAYDLRLLLQALDKCNACDIAYKNSKNQRLLVELTLMQLCSLSNTGETSEKDSKKKDNLLKPPQAEDKTNVSNKPSSQTENKSSTSDKPVPPNPVQQNEQTEPEETEWARNQPKPSTPEKQEKLSVPEKSPVSDTTENTISEPVLEEVESTPSEPQQQGFKPKLQGKLKNTVRISSYIEEPEVEKKKEGDVEKEEQRPETAFEHEDFKKLWKTMATEAENQGQLTLLSIFNKQPIIKENFEVDLLLDNKAQEEEFILQQADILERLRQSLDNYKISFNIAIDKDESNKKAYTASEKFKKMAEKNPNLNTLKDRFGLDINL